MKSVYSLQSTVYRRQKRKDRKGAIYSLRIFLFSVLCSLFSVLCFSASAEQELITCQADKIEYSQDGKEIIASGNVVVVYEGTKITCDELRVNTETKDSYAYGKVVLSEGENEMTGGNLFYNLDTKTGGLDNAVLSSPIWYGKGKKIDKLSDNKFEIHKGYVTTCDPRQRHCADYKIYSQKIGIVLEKRVRAKNVIFWVGKFPLFYLPFYSYSLKGNRPHIRVSGGHTKDWGTFAKSASRFNIDGNEGHFLLDYYERKGLAEGVDYEYFSNFGEGELKTYYIYERETLEKEGEAIEKEKFRVELKHYYEMNKDTDLRLEYHRFSDAEFNKDYFEAEYEKESQPASYISLTYSPGDYVLSAKVKKRMNRFWTVVQQFPELKFDLPDTRLGETNFYFQNESSFNNFYKEYADYKQNDEKARRLDTYNQLSYQISRLWNFLDVRPYVGTRQTYYNEDKNGKEDMTRGVYYGGLDLSTRFFRIYDFESELWGIEVNKLKHIIKPKASYNYIHEPKLSASRLYQFDGVDSIGKQNAITLTLENILQTKRKVRKFSKNEDLGEVYPLYDISEEKRKVVNLASLTVGTDCKMHTEGHQLDDITGELDLNPYDWLNMNIDTSYDSYARGVAFKNRFKTVNADITTKGERWDFTLGSRYQELESHELSGELNCVLNSLWRIGIYERYDFIKQKNPLREGYSAVHGYKVVHELPCWIVELNYDFKKHETKNNSALLLIFRIKALPGNAAEISKS